MPKKREITAKQREKFRQEGIELYGLAQVPGNHLATDLVKDHNRQIEEWEEGNCVADEPASVEVMSGYTLAEHGFPVNMTKTQRGFALGEFVDRYGEACTIQKSSLAGDSAIWFGVHDPKAQMMARNAPEEWLAPKSDTERRNGYVIVPLPEGASINARMHLTRDMVRELLPLLRHFVNTGELPDG